MKNGNIIHISPKPDSFRQYLRKTLASLPLIRSFASSEIQGRAAQTWLGHFLAVIQILITMCLYWLIFGIILKVDTGNIPFPVFVLTGVIPWFYFSRLVQEGGNSLISSQHLITKVYFPRVILPLSKALPGLIDFFIALAVAILLMLFWKMPLRIEMLTIPVFLLLLIYSGSALGIWIASISVKFRDFSKLIPHLINFGFFITPVFYPTTIVPDHLEFIMYINPAAFAIEGIRWGMFGTSFPEAWYLVSLIPVTIFLFWGWHNLRKKEKRYADII